MSFLGDPYLNSATILFDLINLMHTITIYKITSHVITLIEYITVNTARIAKQIFYISSCTNMLWLKGGFPF